MSLVEKAEIIYKTFLACHSICKSHGYEHALLVLSNCRKALAAFSDNNTEQTIPIEDNLRISCELAALLHDADDHKLFPKN
jgi:hypothetical protein